MNDKRTKSAATTGILAALAASSCCIPPVIAAVAGVGGISSSLSWMEPLRPYMIGLAILAIAYAWYVYLKPKNIDDCGCDIDQKPKWYQTKGFLISITLFSIVSISFPYYSEIFYPENTSKTITINEDDIEQASLTIDGMTCESCEHHVDFALNKNEGVTESSSSYKTGIASVTFDKTKVSLDSLIQSLEEETGYTVINKTINP